MKAIHAYELKPGYMLKHNGYWEYGWLTVETVNVRKVGRYTIKVHVVCSSARGPVELDYADGRQFVGEVVT